MKNKLKNLTPNNYIIDYWREEVKHLDKKEINIKIADFDYTIFSRDEQLEKAKYLQENRGNLGPKAIIEKDGIKNFMKKYYHKKKFPNDIIKLFDKKHDLIITAGVYEWQAAKLIACKLDKYNYIITENAQDKILAIIRYVIYKLKFIPIKISIYEDRPQYFIKYRDLIENVLGTKLDIYLVEMDGNRGYKKIELQK